MGHSAAYRCPPGQRALIAGTLREATRSIVEIQRQRAVGAVQPSAGRRVRKRGGNACLYGTRVARTHWLRDARIRSAVHARSHAESHAVRCRRNFLVDPTASPRPPRGAANSPAVLARLGAADRAIERAAPGCFAGREVGFGSRLRLVVPATDARCDTRMVEPNPDDFDRRLSRSSIQLVTLRALPREPPRGGLVGVRREHLQVTWMNQAFVWGTDWNAFCATTLGGS